jgi:hypothetical protein
MASSFGHVRRGPLGLLALALAAWFGMLLAVSALAAPALFATLERAQAAAVAGRLFTFEAKLSLCLAGLLLLAARAWSARLKSQDWPAEAAQWEAVSVMSWGALWVLFTTLLSEEVLRPWMAQAKAGGETVLGFASLHALAGLLFALKAAALAWMAWRALASQNAAMPVKAVDPATEG